MHLSGLSKYALRVSYSQASLPVRPRVPSSVMFLACLGLGLSTFSTSKLFYSPGRRASLLGV